MTADQPEALTAGELGDLAAAYGWWKAHGEPELFYDALNDAVARILAARPAPASAAGSTESVEVYVVHTAKGFTETFGRRTIDTLEALGLIRHERDGYALEDGNGLGVGPLHRYYCEATR